MSSAKKNVLYEKLFCAAANLRWINEKYSFWDFFFHIKLVSRWIRSKIKYRIKEKVMWKEYMQIHSNCFPFLEGLCPFQLVKCIAWSVRVGFSVGIIVFWNVHFVYAYMYMYFQLKMFSLTPSTWTSPLNPINNQPLPKIQKKKHTNHKAYQSMGSHERYSNNFLLQFIALFY